MNAVSLKKLEFDKVANYATQFCLSAMGRDRLLEAVPQVGREALVAELERVLELRNLLQEGSALPFSWLPDTRPLLKKLEILESYLEPEELQDIHHLLFSSVQLRKFMFLNREVYPLLNEFTIRLWLEKSLQASIRRIIDEQSRVRDTASEALLMIRRELSGSRELIRRKMERLLRRCQESGWLMEDTIAIKNGRLTLGLRVEYKYKIAGYIQDYSGSGQTVFIEPAETLEISNRIQDLEISERREIERILKEMTEELRPEIENLRYNETILGEFDALYARARFAVETNSVLPGIAKGHSLRIVKGFHPWLLISHHQKEVLPLDLDLDEDDRVLVISGPNAGGKSVAMKTAGLLCCMLVHGYLLPCSESSVFPLFGDIFIEIGDDQSIENDLSTFSSHLGAIKTILDVAGSSDLVLIDELCAGTDVEEGGAIARAVMEELLNRGTKTIVTTHLGDLKAYAHEREGVVNGAMEFNRAGLVPTFRFVKGLPGNSFAFAMMKRMGFPETMVERASGFMQDERIGLDRMLDDLSRLFEENRLLKQQLEAERADLAARELSLRTEEARMERKRRDLKLGASRELQKEVESARKEIKEIVQEVKSTPTDAKAVQEARKKLGLKKQEAEKSELSLRAEAEMAVPLDRTIREGDLVRILDTSTSGEVESVNQESVVVLCGNFRLTTSLKNLEKTSKTQAKKIHKEPLPRQQKVSWSATTSGVESTKLDLRGLSGDEAIMKIDRFIDTMRLNRIHSAMILHGKGTGSLRQRTAEFLQQHSAVKSFRLGEWGEGGAGVTVVELE
ncbi:endonuclease MutS2 [Pelodictyon phaeoclathratiforme]|uniref:Endonuclease MutS2 n=1 Tax=Pelodictyon phaeoclathratiforme (strain DSM 5477 / BU-1) TaxID=324925 RepID=B4SDQ4_PELPB|nr:Smr/MutS family protein [Pelodictyon phaeoclathratiforme]ACF44422.1 Smr protein/MutS2 [Pelodictyon phaeoclathratiforme BU-1]MBV5289366.1 Smr/MutS family protein [Pelodictyon phaeoclathratiforme]